MRPNASRQAVLSCSTTSRRSTRYGHPQECVFYRVRSSSRLAFTVGCHRHADDNGERVRGKIRASALWTSSLCTESWLISSQDLLPMMYYLSLEPFISAAPDTATWEALTAAFDSRSPSARQSMVDLLQTLMWRNTKNMVASQVVLPKVTDKTHTVSLGTFERALYQAQHHTMRLQLQDELDEREWRWAKYVHTHLNTRAFPASLPCSKPRPLLLHSDTARRSAARALVFTLHPTPSLCRRTTPHSRSSSLCAKWLLTCPSSSAATSAGT